LCFQRGDGEKCSGAGLVSALFGPGRDKADGDQTQGFALDDNANAFFTTAESFDQPQASELSSQGVDFGRSAGCFAAREGLLLGVNTNGGPAG